MLNVYTLDTYLQQVDHVYQCKIIVLFFITTRNRLILASIVIGVGFD